MDNLPNHGGNFSGNIHYLEYNPAGDRCVVLIHGLGVTGASWALQVQDLEKHGYRVLCPDIPGFGKSPWPKDKTWSVKQVSQALASWLSTVAPGGADIAGLSMGGVFAQVLAFDYPELVHKLVLINTFSRLSTANPGQWIYYGRRYFLVMIYGLRAQAGLVAERLFPGQDQEIYRQLLIQQIMDGDEHTYRQAMLSLALVNTDNRLNQITQPVLVISGECDTTIPIHFQERMAKKIPGAIHTVIPEAGHAVIVDQAEVFNRIMIGFLSDD